MKKFLPLILLLLGVVVFVGVFLFLKTTKKEDNLSQETETSTEIAVNQRPFTSLTPKSDGHWLKLKVEDIKLDADSLDYELLYKVSDGRTQGVPGTLALKGEQSFERDILLGSESSGKFRYDTGVETGTLTLRFRNKNGKLIGRLSTDFHLLSGVKELSSVDKKFTFTLDKTNKAYFVVMETFGLPNKFVGEIKSGPYGVFSSSDLLISGIPSLKEGKVTKVSLNVFVSSE